MRKKPKFCDGFLRRPPARAQASGIITVSILQHGHGTAGDVHRATVAIFIVLAVPDQLGLPSKERMRVVRAPADGIRHVRGPPENGQGMKRTV
ncbi:MAG: hypothetical protein ACP5OU_04610 [Methanothrix sp.]